MKLTLLSLLAAAAASVLTQHDTKDHRLRTRNAAPYFGSRPLGAIMHHQYRRNHGLIPRGLERTSRSNSLVELNRTPSPQPQRNPTNYSPAGKQPPVNGQQRSPSPPAKLTGHQQKMLDEKLNRWSQSPSPGSSPRNDQGYHWTMFGWRKNGEGHEGTEMKNMVPKLKHNRAHASPQEAMLNRQMQGLTIPKNN